MWYPVQRLKELFIFKLVDCGIYSNALQIPAVEYIPTTCRKCSSSELPSVIPGN